MKIFLVPYLALRTVLPFAITATGMAAFFQATPDRHPVFEVASIKPAPKQDLSSQNPFLSGKPAGAMTVNGARVDFSAATLSNLLIAAYGVKASQIVGPDWLGSQRFEIHATIPEGASKDQIPEMLQALLADRFKLVAHRENKEQPIYALVVSKGGPKLKEAVDDPLNPKDDPAQIPSDPDNPGKGSKTNLPSTSTSESSMSVKQWDSGIEAVMNTKRGGIRISVDGNGNVHEEIPKMTMTQLAGLLTPMMDRPVVDMTDLRGSYQLTLELPRQATRNLMRSIGVPDPELGATAGSAAGTGGLADIAVSDPSDGGISHVVQQLGLKLDSRNVPVETLVIDRIEKNPTEN